MHLRTILFFAAGLLAIAGYVHLADRGEPVPSGFNPVPTRDGWHLISLKGLPAFERTAMRFQVGDDPAWADPKFDDSAWMAMQPWDVPARDGVFWLRWKVRAAGPGEALQPGIYITAVSAYELYWDGGLLGRNGAPGNSAGEEVSGQLDRSFPLSAAQASPGEHYVAMRASTHRCGFSQPKSGFITTMESPTSKLEWRARNAVVPTLAAGAMLVLAITAAILWSFNTRRREFAWVTLLCVSASGMQTLSIVRWVFNYRSDCYYLVIYGSVVLHAIMAVSLVGLVLSHLVVPRARWWLAGVCAAMAVIAQLTPPVRNTEGAYMMTLACAVVAVVAGYRRRQGHAGALYVMCGALITGAWTLLDPRSYTWTGFLPRFMPTLIGATLMLASAARRERVEAERTRQMAARLELELLKKNLQPHFLLNTLTALSELVEHRPADAVGLIEDLAGEFRLIAAMATERTVPLGQELALCRTHLRILGVRTGRDFRLETTDVDESATMPPAVFLTLIENAFSHQRTNDSPVTFRLTAERDDAGTVHYRFLSPGQVVATKKSTGGGTGLRYVRARLEECFPRHWSFHDGASAGGWQTCITIHGREALA